MGKRTVRAETIETGEAFHLFQEVFESGSVHLRLDGVQFQAEVPSIGKPSVTVKMSIALAKDLGLIKDYAELPEQPKG